MSARRNTRWARQTVIGLGVLALLSSGSLLATANAHWFLSARRFYGPDHTGWRYPNARYGHGWSSAHDIHGPGWSAWSFERGVLPENFKKLQPGEVPYFGYGVISPEEAMVQGPDGMMVPGPDGMMMPGPNGMAPVQPGPAQPQQRNMTIPPRTTIPNKPDRIRGIPRGMPLLGYETETSVTISATMPEEARLFVNGKETRIAGPYRRFVSRQVEPNSSYRYELRAEMMRDGKLVSETQFVDVRTGDVAEVEFTFANAISPELLLPQASSK